MSTTDEVPEPESAGFDAGTSGVDPVPDQSAVSDALARLTHLDPAKVFGPDGTGEHAAAIDMPIEHMPDFVWEQLSTVLALEQASRTGGGAGSEILSFPTGGRRRLNLTSGLIAASVALLAVGIAVVALRPTASTDVVAGSVVADAAPQSDAAASAPLPESALGSPEVLQAGFVPPARAVTQTDMAYTPENVVGQIDALLDGYGMDSAAEMMAMQSPPAMKKAMRTNGFMASDEALRNCITMLTQSERSQALIVDRAEYMGSDAGVIVIPAFMAIDISTPPPSELPVTLDIWVVGPNCGEQDGAVLRRFTHTLD